MRVNQKITACIPLYLIFIGDSEPWLSFHATGLMFDSLEACCPCSAANLITVRLAVCCPMWAATGCRYVSVSFDWTVYQYIAFSKFTSVVLFFNYQHSSITDVGSIMCRSTTVQSLSTCSIEATHVTTLQKTLRAIIWKVSLLGRRCKDANILYKYERRSEFGVVACSSTSQQWLLSFRDRFQPSTLFQFANSLPSIISALAQVLETQ